VGGVQVRHFDPAALFSRSKSAKNVYRSTNTEVAVGVGLTLMASAIGGCFVVSAGRHWQLLAFLVGIVSVISVSCLVFIESARPRHFRIWTDETRRVRVEAEFQGLADGSVILVHKDGTPLRIPLANLSAEDMSWLCKPGR
jgi:hypothetical protein